MPDKAIDNQGKLTELFMKRLVKFTSKDINCHTVGVVSKYDKNRHRCDVQPLPKKYSGNDRSPLVEVIVPSNIYQQELIEQSINANAEANSTQGIRLNTIGIGSIVIVGFFDRDIENFNGNNTYKLRTERMHSIQDSFIEAVIK